MKPIAIALVAIAATAGTGCATMNPYVQHSRDVSDVYVGRCMGLHTGQDEAVDYTCRMALRMEKARAEVVGTRSALTASVFPLMGIVGYNAARGINDATNAALVAGGFAGYSAVSTLAQPDRIRVYDKGIDSLYCGIGVFQTGLVGAAPESAARIEVRIEAQRVASMIAAERQVTGRAEEKATLEQQASKVEAVRVWLEASHPDRAYSAQLLAFARDTVASVNSQLTLTVPDNKQFAGDALSALQAGLRTSTPRSGGAVEAESLMHRSRIESAVDHLYELYEGIAGDAAATAAPLNFHDCLYADVSDVGFKDPIGRFMLGPGDSYSGATVRVVRPGTFKSTISGGVLPYTASVNAVTGDDQVSADVDGAQLTITVPDRGAGTFTAGRYQVIVNDATNRYSKSLQIEVPETKAD